MVSSSRLNRIPRHRRDMFRLVSKLVSFFSQGDVDMYKAPRGRIIHCDPHCRCLPPNAIQVGRRDDSKHTRFCEQCSNVCMICFSEYGYPMSCSNKQHAVCDNCMYVHLARQTRHTWPKCPCGEGELLVPMTHLSEAHLVTYASQFDEGACDVPKKWTGDELIHVRVNTDVLNNCCPRCGAVYADFDACAAIVCASCNQIFCALCDKQCDSMSEAHQHVAACTMNPDPGNYYVPLDTWHALRRRIVCTKLLRGVATTWQTQGTIATCHVLMHFGRLYMVGKWTRAILSATACYIAGCGLCALVFV